MKPPFYYRFLITLAKPLYRMVLSFQNDKRDAVGLVSQADEFAMRYTRKLPKRPSCESLDKQLSQKQLDEKQSNCDQAVVWVHAVSLGETNTIAPIVNQLLDNGYQIVITNTTHTGYARSQKLFADDDAVAISFIPIDSPKQINQFIQYFQPKLALFVETELWANTLYQLAEKKIPAVLANARLSEKSLKGYQKIAKVSQSMMANLAHIICQDETSKQRFAALGASEEKLSVSPSLKYAVSVPSNTAVAVEQCKQDWQLTNRKIVVASSTHAGEEAMILAVFKTLLVDYENLLLILVPRHPERFDEVADLVAEQGFVAYRRSADDDIDAETQVYVADSMGELFTWYGLADIALVGGSFVPDIGGHNPLEASIMGKPVIMGQYTHKCQYIVNDLLSNQAMKTVDDHQALYHELFQWLQDDSIPQEIGKNALALMQRNQQTVALQYDKLTPFLPKP